MSFFDDASFGVSRKQSSTPSCGACKLHTKCNTPKLPVQGEGAKGVLIVTSHPTKEDDAYGEWFSVKEHLSQYLAEVGLDFEQDCWVTGSVICSPGKLPTPLQVEHCRPSVVSVVEKLKPKVILAIGDAACASLFKKDWKGSASGSINTWSGELVPSQSWNCLVVPITAPELLDGHKDVMLFDMRQAIKAVGNAAKSDKRVWDTVPDYQSMVQVITDDKQAMQAIKRIVKDPRTEYLAIDYETNALKPETSGASIWSVSISNGYETMAAPWYEGVRKACRWAFRSPIPKIACNMKFEERWTVHEFGKGIRNWAWDTMQAAHWMHSRPGITSIKFQAYAKLGVGEYDAGVHSFFKSKPGTLNNIKQVPVNTLLVYNGMDTLLELLVAFEQIEKSGYPLPIKNRFTELRPTPVWT